MKIRSILQEADDTKPSGSYAAVRFDQSTKDAVEKYIKDNKLPNGVNITKLHTTLLYSHKYLPDYKGQGKIDPAWIGTPVGLEVWKSGPNTKGDPKNCLVLKYKCKDLEDRHKFLMDEHDAQYDFPEYKPHITLSYDIGDMNADDLPDVKKAIPEIKIVDEYGEDLVDDFADNATKKDKK